MSANKIGMLLRFVLAFLGLVLALQSYFTGAQISIPGTVFPPGSASNPPIFSDPGWSDDSDDSGGWDFGGGGDSGWDSGGGGWDSSGGDSGSWDSGGGDSGSW